MEENINLGKGTNVMGILAYVGFLVLIPLFTEKKDAFVKFHVKQGLVLFVLELVVWILGSMLWSYSNYLLFQILNLALAIFSIIGIINVVKRKEQELPLIGKFSKYFNF